MPPTSRKRRAPAEGEDEEVSAASHQRGSKRRSVSRDEDDQVDEEEEDQDREQEQEANGGGSFEQLSKSLVRYALACEYSRKPIRRPDVNEKVLGSHTRAFRQVFDAANAQLRDTFGMEMVELPTKDKITQRQKKAAAKSESQSKSSGQWTLRNVLPDRYRAPDIIEPSQVPTAEDESVYTGLYTFIVTLILLAGGRLAEAQLDRHLKRLNADQSTPLERTDRVLARMIKDNYIIKVRETSAGEELVDYMVGPRGKVEVGDEGAAGLVRTVYGEGAVEDLEQRIDRSLGISERERREAEQQTQAANGSGTQGARRGPGRPGRSQEEREGEWDE